jgi:hypothetical protein
MLFQYVYLVQTIDVKPLQFSISLRYYTLPWQRGVVVIVFAIGSEGRGFESRQRVRFLGATH